MSGNNPENETPPSTPTPTIGGVDFLPPQQVTASDVREAESPGSPSQPVSVLRPDARKAALRRTRAGGSGGGRGGGYSYYAMFCVILGAFIKYNQLQLFSFYNYSIPGKGKPKPYVQVGLTFDLKLLQPKAPHTTDMSHIGQYNCDIVAMNFVVKDKNNGGSDQKQEEGGKDLCTVKLTERRATGFTEDTVFPQNIQAQRDSSVFDQLDFNRLQANPVVRKYLDVHGENSLQILEEAGFFQNPDSTFIDIFKTERAVEVESGVDETNRDGVIYGMFCGEPPSQGMGVEVKYEMEDGSYEYFSGEITSAVRNEESNFTISVAFDEDDTGNFEYPFPDLVDIELDRDMNLVKVGWTGNTTGRLIHYRNHDTTYPDFNATCQMLGLIYFDTIPYEVDQLLAQQKLRLFQGVISDPEATPPMIKFFESMLSQKETEKGREWHRGGPGRNFMAQMIEYAVQKRLSKPGRLLASPAEGFMFNNTKHDYMVNKAVEAVDELIIVNNKFIPENLRNGNVRITHISTWATGCKEGKLSSAIVSGEFMIGPGGTWFDTMPQALYPNAKTAEEMFAHNFTDDQYDQADHRLCTSLQQHRICPDEPHVMYVDTQGYMYLDMVEIQKIAYRLGFRHSLTILGGEIIVYEHTRCMTQIKFHGHLAEAADSRPVKSVLDAEKRGITISALKQDRRYLTGQAANANDGFDDSAILGTQVTEIITEGLHIKNKAKKFAVVPYKDLVTPPDVSATDRCDLLMTPAYANGGSFLNPSSDYARLVQHRDLTRAELTPTKVINRFSNATHETLPSFLTRFDNQLSNGKSVSDRNRDWNRIMTEYLPPVEREALIISIDEWAESNGKVVRVTKRSKWSPEEEALIDTYAGTADIEANWNEIRDQLDDKTLKQAKAKWKNIQSAKKKEQK